MRSAAFGRTVSTRSAMPQEKILRVANTDGSRGSVRTVAVSVWSMGNPLVSARLGSTATAGHNRKEPRGGTGALT